MFFDEFSSPWKSLKMRQRNPFTEKFVSLSHRKGGEWQQQQQQDNRNKCLETLKEN